MRLEIGNDQGHVVIDDATGKIIFVMVQNAIEGKFDYHSFGDYKNNHDGTHKVTRWCANHAIQQEEDEAAAEERMLIIMQNGNTGEHYDLLDEE